MMNYILFGEEEYLIEQRVNAILKEVLSEHAKEGTTYYDALTTSMQEIMDDASMLPLFTDRKVIIVQNPFFLTASLSSSAVVDEELFHAYFQYPSDLCVLIFVCYHALDERRKIVKFLRKHCYVEEFKKLENYELQRFVTQELKSAQVKIKDRDIEYLCKMLGNDLLTIKQELEKLKLYDGVIDTAVIQALITRPLEDNIFELVNAVMARDMRKSFVIWNDFITLNKEPLQLIGALAAQFRFCYQVAYLQSSGLRDDEIAKELGCKPYRVTKTKSTMHRGTPDQFLGMLAMLSELDQKIKNGLIDKYNGFELFLIQIGMEGSYGVHYGVI